MASALTATLGQKKPCMYIKPLSFNFLICEMGIRQVQDIEGRNYVYQYIRAKLHVSVAVPVVWLEPYGWWLPASLVVRLE